MSVLTSPRVMPETEEDAWPRDAENRYRIYRLRRRDLRVMCTTATPQGIGVALVTLHEDGEFDRDDALGVLDTHGRQDISGTWIVSPYATGGRR